MQEFLLFSQVPAAREHQVLSILAGVTEQQPHAICEHHLLYAQVKLPEVAAAKRFNNAKQPKQPQLAETRLSYHQLIRNVVVNEDGTTAQAGPWQFRAEQTPYAGETDVLSRTVDERGASSQDMERVRQPQWYRYHGQYVAQGHRLVHGNIIIKIYRVLSAPVTGDPIDDAAPVPSSMQAVDASGSWIVECVVRVADGSNANLAGMAKAELTEFKDYMAGALDLYAPDRLSLDTRVKQV